MANRWSWVLALVCAGCPSQPPNPPPQPPDAADGAPYPVPPMPATQACLLACEQMRTVGCKAGSDPNCPGVMQLDNDRRRIRTPAAGYMTCAGVAAAKTVDDMHAAGIPCP